MFDTSTGLNLFDAVIVLAVAIPSLYMATRIGQQRLRTLTSLLAAFLLFHGLYHLTYVLSDLTGATAFEAASELFFAPFGYLLFLVFAVYFAWRVT